MKTLTKAFCLLLALLLVCSLCACSGGSSNSRSSNSSYASSSAEITHSSDAIWAVKNHMSGTPFSLEQEIAAELGFNNFYSPDYATATASENYDGSWEVTIKGKMSGYTDEYNDDFESYKFQATAEVSPDGWVSNIRVKKVY